MDSRNGFDMPKTRSKCISRSKTRLVATASNWAICRCCWSHEWNKAAIYERLLLMRTGKLFSIWLIDVGTAHDRLSSKRIGLEVMPGNESEFDFLLSRFAHRHRREIAVLRTDKINNKIASIWNEGYMNRSIYTKCWVSEQQYQEVDKIAQKHPCVDIDWCLQMKISLMIRWRHFAGRNKIELVEWNTHKWLSTVCFAYIKPKSKNSLMNDVLSWIFLS